MTRRNYLLGLVAALMVGTSVRAQESHVEIRYDKSSDMTLVTSDTLYAVNMPAQFMQVQMTARYRKQGKPAEAPTSIGLQFFSYAPKPLYQLDDSHRLKVKADEQVLDLGLLVYSKIEEKYEGKDGLQATNSAARAGLPANALVRNISKNEGLTLEIMSVRRLSLADVHTLANAESVVMKIGETVFPLKPIHMTILRQFVSAITPPSGVIVEEKKVERPPVPADVPSDANNASLDDTMKWLQTHLDRHASDKGANVLVKLETQKFKDCTINYRLIPRVKNPPNSSALSYVVLEYKFNLRDINPEIVTVANRGDYATVSLTTRDAQPKILVLDHKNEYGTMGRTVDEHKRMHVVISLKKIEAADSLRVALIHAINLCTR